MSQARARETSLAQRVLSQELERAFGGDRGVHIFVRAALRAARATTLPSEPGPLLDFVRAHMLAVVTGEFGARGAREFLARFVAAMDGLSLATALDSGVQVRGPPKECDANDGTTLHPVEPIRASAERGGNAATPTLGPVSSGQAPSVDVASVGRTRARLAACG